MTARAAAQTSAPGDAKELAALLPHVRKVAAHAGERILALREKMLSGRGIDYKADKTPVTEADLASHEAIRKGLARLTPGLPQLSEESASVPYAERRRWDSFWLIDPLDGTRAFIEGFDEFGVLIALITGGEPRLGVVHMPASGATYEAAAGGGARKRDAAGRARRIRARSAPGRSMSIAVSRAHTGKQTQRFIAQFDDIELERCDSIVKCCLVAEGKVDLYPRFGPTGEWDTGAGQCVLEEAGGALTDFDGRRLRYNTRESLINPPFMAAAPSAGNWRALLPD